MSDLIAHLGDLIVATQSSAERKKLTDQQAKLAGQLQVLIDKIVDETLPEYVKATTALKEANDEAKKAKVALDKIAATITKIADAADKVAALAAKAAA